MDVEKEEKERVVVENWHTLVATKVEKHLSATADSPSQDKAANVVTCKLPSISVSRRFLIERRRRRKAVCGQRALPHTLRRVRVPRGSTRVQR